MSALAGLSSLVSTVTAQIGWTASNNVTGSDYAPNSNSSTLKKSLSIGTAIANATAGGGDELYSAITTLTASASVSIDFTSISDILASVAGSVARIKAIMIRVLSTTDDSVVGTAASGILIDDTVANGLSAQSHSGWFDNGSEGGVGGSAFSVPNGGVLLFATPSAGGIVVDSTHKVIKLTNQDGGVSAKVQVTIIGGHS